MNVPNLVYIAGFYSLLCTGTAVAGGNFTLVATEKNTKDMSVGLGGNALREATRFAGREILPPSTVAGRDEILKLGTHNDGILDVMHSMVVNGNMSSRTLIEFTELEQELKAHCWTAAEASEIQATLRLYVIGPHGPDKHNRAWGVSPSVHFPPSVGSDWGPASVPIGVFRQEKAWVEGTGQNDFFTATYNQDKLLDVKRIGVAAQNTTWNGEPIAGVDLCLNRQAGLMAVGKTDRVELCFDDTPNWQPWMEFDVSEAVRFWLENDFDPTETHGFSLYQVPGLTVEDQIRIEPEIPGFARSRPIVSFASSSGVADCEGANGEWGGAGGIDLIYGNFRCMSTRENDLEPENPFGAPRFVTPKTRPEWAPQLVISGETLGECLLGASTMSKGFDATIHQSRTQQLELVNHTDTDLEVVDMSIAGPNASMFSVEAECASISAQSSCVAAVALQGDTIGEFGSTLHIEYQIDGQEDSRFLKVPVNGTVSEDSDGIPSAIEDLATNEDGNGDGTPDRTQAHVTSIQTSGKDILTLAVSDNVKLSSVSTPDLSTDDELFNAEFKYGFIGFTMDGVAVGGKATAKLHFSAEQADRFYVTDTTGAWSALPDTQVEHSWLLLSIVDGGTGDFDGQANGRVVILGGPAIDRGTAKVKPTDTSTSSGSIDAFFAVFIACVFLSGAFLQCSNSSQHESV